MVLDALDTPGTKQHGLGRMVGDVNLFFHPWLCDEQPDRGLAGAKLPQSERVPEGLAAGQSQSGIHHAAEVEVMIAEPDARRHGLASEALRLLLGFAVVELHTRKFVAKIGFANHASQRLFSKRLGFVETDRDEGFEEVELQP